jgi:hypothetical protein
MGLCKMSGYHVAHNIFTYREAQTLEQWINWGGKGQETDKRNVL